MPWEVRGLHPAMARIVVLVLFAALSAASAAKVVRRESMADGSDRDIPTLPEGMTEHVVGASGPGASNSAEKAAEAEKKSSPAYAESVMASNPIGYWSMGDVSTNQRTSGKGRACGIPHGLDFGDPCHVDGEIKGSPELRSGLLPSNNENQAMTFSGLDNEEVVIPDSSFINTNESGYRERTVELWFQTHAPDNPLDNSGSHINRTVYCEGNEAHSGLSMYVQEDDLGKVWLNMFAWDRGNHDEEFGTALVNPDPIRCVIEKDTTYYTVMQFNGNNHSFTGWIGRPDSGVQLCGQLTDIPMNVRLRHHGHGGGNAVIGGIHTSSRASGIVQMLADAHNFKGVVDEVAIYNRVLPETEMHDHFNLGTTIS